MRQPVQQLIESRELFEEVMKLSDKYRIVIHLFYYEDYSVREISNILKISEINVKIRLSHGRAMLKDSLKEESSEPFSFGFTVTRPLPLLRF